MKNRFFYLNDLKSIAWLFIICICWISLVFLVSRRGTGWGFIEYNGYQSPPPFPVEKESKKPFPDKKKKVTEQSMPLPKPPEPPKKLERKFYWEDPKKVFHETVFQIEEKLFNDELKEFGFPPQITNPYIARMKGFKLYSHTEMGPGHQILESFTGEVDYRQVFKRNVPYFKTLTAELSASAQLLPGMDPLYSFLCFVQQIRYSILPKVYRGKFIGGFFVPLVVLVEQYADCDSKVVLLAEFLATFAGSTEKVALVKINGRGMQHAILAVKRNPLPGMNSMFDMKKGYYIIMETSSPGWSPGFISPRVLDVLKAGFYEFLEFN